jgi:protein gp37
MADKSGIEWTDATWNPVTGCTKIGPGCDHCYAERFAERFRGVAGHPYENGFDLTLRPERLDQPLRWKRSRMIFVNSMSDLFHKNVPTDFVTSVFEIMEKADQHIYQVLTKRSTRLASFINSRYPSSSAPDHIWLGVSVEDRQRASRIGHLRRANATVRFLSIEPLLGPIGPLNLEGISWVIVGGESGPRARPMDASWARDVRDQCRSQHVAFFFKQWGGASSKSGGRVLDGETHDQFPVQIRKSRTEQDNAKREIPLDAGGYSA